MVTRLARKTPLKRKRSTPRRVRITCVTRSCKRLPTAGAMCLTHAKRKADELWGQRVRNGTCDLAGVGGIRCAGVNQACHGISRGYMGTRYSLENGFSGCAAHNFFAEIRPLEWDEFLRQRWGAETYLRLRELALHFGEKGEHVDYEAVIKDLGGEREAA